MFTSITALRKSHADQSSVTKVATNLKKLNPNWNDDWLFPYIAVGLSNTLDDVTWVEHNDVKLDSTGKHVYVVADSVTSTTASKLNGAIATMASVADIQATQKVASIKTALQNVNTVLGKMFGIESYSWVLNPVVLDKPKMPATSAPAYPYEAPVEKVADTPSTTTVPLGEKEGIPLTVLRKWFEEAFKDDIEDFAIATSVKTPNGKYYNDRTQGKFVGFCRALELVYSGVINLDGLSTND